MCSTSSRKSGSAAAWALKSSTTAGAISLPGATWDTSSPSRPVTQWHGASKCVPVCSPVVMSFQYQAGPRSSKRLTSCRLNEAVLLNGGGSLITGVDDDSGAVRSTISTVALASASVRALSTDMGGSCPRGLPCFVLGPGLRYIHLVRAAERIRDPRGGGSHVRQSQAGVEGRAPPPLHLAAAAADLDRRAAGHLRAAHAVGLPHGRQVQPARRVGRLRPGPGQQRRPLPAVHPPAR